MQDISLGKKIWKTLTGIQGIVTFIMMTILPFMVFVQVLLRYVFQAPLMGIEELMLYPIIWLYMLGGANASLERNHITCGILTLYIKRERSMQIFNIVKSLISLLISLWLTYWSYWYFMYSLKTWKYTNLVKVPLFFGESALFVGLVLMTTYTAVELIDYIKMFLRGLRNYS
ncbi:TRAP transporter small permease [Maledivibacter halophilus]|uniref:TRAP-type C4-dicarboxylate transport system, small permease component n=1 Tax=Maledivibacter halophilus TaxID=36842 RepID=A0A1T5JJA5_9FIRM|nr:TRAP transporter small permease subunit [Maledivibacter halophilus]SKC51426.1 TRAP-type C4-dicarboxylate transport system, small permease component [Maledivibacter halophilus]